MKKQSIFFMISLCFALTVCGGCAKEKEAENQTQETNEKKENADDTTSLYDTLSEEQREYLENELGFEKDEIEKLSEEELNSYFQGTGLELYEKSSGVERNGVCYETEDVNLAAVGTEEMTWQQAYDIRLKDTEMRLDDFLAYACEVKQDEETTMDGNDTLAYQLWVPLAGYENTFIRTAFSIDGTTVKMKAPYLYYANGEEDGKIYSLLYHTGLRDYFLETKDHEWTDKLLVGFQCEYPIKESAAIEIFNKTEQDCVICDDFTLWKISDGNERTEVVKAANGEEKKLAAGEGSIRRLKFGKELEQGSYVIGYGRDEDGYVYKELTFEVR